MIQEYWHCYSYIKGFITSEFKDKKNQKGCQPQNHFVLTCCKILRQKSWCQKLLHTQIYMPPLHWWWAQQSISIQYLKISPQKLRYLSACTLSFFEDLLNQQELCRITKSHTGIQFHGRTPAPALSYTRSLKFQSSVSFQLLKEYMLPIWLPLWVV